MPRVLLTGFEPFGSFKTNPSWEALKLAQKSGLLPKTAAFRLAEIPVEYGRAFEVFNQAVLQFKPAVAISFGVHGTIAGRGAETIYLERVARNWDDATKADNAGQQRLGAAIIENAPASLNTSYPIAELHGPLQQAGYSVEFSDSAGGYLCNHLYFLACHSFNGIFPTAFVHVPRVKEDGGVLLLERLAQAAAVVAIHAARVAER